MLKFAVAFLLCSVAACSIIGGFNEVAVDDERVVAAATHATKELSQQDRTPYHIRLHEVVEATQQVVAGMNYKMEVSIGVTECKKDEVDYEDIETCEFQKGGWIRYRRCKVQVFRDLKGNHHLKSSACTVN